MKRHRLQHSINNNNTKKHPKKTPPTTAKSHHHKTTPIYAKLPSHFSLKSLILIFLALGIIRIITSLTTPIPDCDEVFNYWEPMHLLMPFGTEQHHVALQTWEFSPVYALRSWLYVWIGTALGIFWKTIWRLMPSFVTAAILQHSPLMPFTTLSHNLSLEKILVFYSVRCSWGIMSALCEAFFLWGISCRYERRVSMMAFVFLCLSSGMSLEAHNYLPSAFSMYCIMMAFGSWFYTDKTPSQTALKWIMCVCAAGTGVIVGWPFSVVCVLPLAMDTIYQAGFIPACKIAFAISFFWITISMAMDYMYYEKFLFAQWNLVNYNKGEGSEKYGTEPWNFYLKNLFLNFNGAFVLSLLAPIVILLRSLVLPMKTYYSSLRLLFDLCPYYIWLIFFSALPHKEERFMLVVYPMICLSAAMCLEYSFQLVDYIWNEYLSGQNKSLDGSKRGGRTNAAKNTERRIVLVRPPKRSWFSWICIAIITLIFVVLSVSRTYAVVRNYSAPLKIYQQLSLHIEEKRREPTQVVNVCVGKEWYRFPSSFFLPGVNTRLRFLRSSFRGLLPKYYPEWPYSTSAIPTGMNDDNREEMDRYISESQCHYIVDLDLPNQKEKRYIADTENWQLLAKVPFLNQEASPQWSRIFWIPGGVFEKHNVYVDYYVVERRKKR